MKNFRKGALALVIMLGLSSVSPIVGFAETDIESNNVGVEETVTETEKSEEVLQEEIALDEEKKSEEPTEPVELEKEIVLEETNIENVVELEKTEIQEMKPATRRVSLIKRQLPPIQLSPVTTNDRFISGNGFEGGTEVVLTAYLPTGGFRSFNTATNNYGGFQVYIGEPFPVNTKIFSSQRKCGWETSRLSFLWVSAYVDPNPKPNPKPMTPTIGEVTEESTNISGTTTPNVHVELKISGDIYRTVSDASGKFLITLDECYIAGRIIEVFAYDSLNNRSETTLASVLPGRMSLGIDYISTRDRMISGNTAANMYVEVTIGNRVYSGYSDLSGKFNIPISMSYKAGTSVLVTVFNLMTKQSVKANAMIYPARPSINYVMPGAAKITGTVDPGAFVTIRVSDGNKISALANVAGYYEVIVNPIYTAKGKTIIVSQFVNNMTSQDVEYTIN